MEAFKGELGRHVESDALGLSATRSFSVKWHLYISYCLQMFKAEQALKALIGLDLMFCDLFTEMLLFLCFAEPFVCLVLAF